MDTVPHDLHGPDSPRRLPHHPRRRSVGLGLAAALLTAALAPVTAHAADGDLIECAPGPQSVTWDGSTNDVPGNVGDGSSWGDPYNWDQDCVPGYRYLLSGPPQTPAPYDDTVTIPSHVNGNPVHVFIRSGGSAHLAALHNAGALTVSGATLETRGSSTSHTLTLKNSYLAGTGTFTVTSTLSLYKSAQTTRRCDFAEVSCAALPTTVGTTVVGPSATLRIFGYLNLWDRRTIENQGTTILRPAEAPWGAGYIAADDGTAFDNTAGARFKIASNLGYYQGYTQQDLVAEHGPAWSAVGPSIFTNSGTVEKTGGGTSLVAADYSDTGVEVVKTGRLSILTPNGSTTLRSAKVDGGSTFGNAGPDSGACNLGVGAGCGLISPTSADPQVTTVQITKPGIARPTPVKIKELAPGIEAPVEIMTPDATDDGAYSFDRPLRFRIYMQLASGNPATVAENAPVYRNGSLVPLPDCNATSQDPTPTKRTCVARRLSKQETTASAFAALPGQDVVIVISSVQNSRYRVGH